ncbi:MAG: lytic transglycosylase domain-containing protein [Thermodesulfobacteriota bacterium]|nr:lytic transglycosylase domain-containing protein [Thermodesulfobacteriota bacterium]
MSPARVILAAALALALSLFVNSPVTADIYRYVDKDGVWHFTNIKTESRYRLYIRTQRKDPSEYIGAYEGIIDQASRRFGIDPSLVKAVIKAESGFDRRAISRKGALGLMQLMPQTAEAMDVDNPFNPEENIFGGTRYLSLLLDRFQNNKELAVAAYNAGPENVESYQGIPPFPETKAFVERVMDYYHLYNSRPE